MHLSELYLALTLLSFKVAIQLLELQLLPDPRAFIPSISYPLKTYLKLTQEPEAVPD